MIPFAFLKSFSQGEVTPRDPPGKILFVLILVHGKHWGWSFSGFFSFIFISFPPFEFHSFILNNKRKTQPLEGLFCQTEMLFWT